MSRYGEIVKQTGNSRAYDQPGSLDEYMTDICLNRTVSEMLMLRERPANARAYFVASLVFNAIFEKDMECIRQIATRIDGTVPEDKERSLFANLMGDAIEDVLSLTDGEQTRVFPDDRVIIALAKVVLHLSTMQVGKSVSMRKDRALAIDMILSRTGGRKTEPTRMENLIEYVEPEWMALPGNADE